MGQNGSKPRRFPYLALCLWVNHRADTRATSCARARVVTATPCASAMATSVFSSLNRRETATDGSSQKRSQTLAALLRQAGPVRVSCHVVKCRHPPNFPFNLNCRHMLANSNHLAKFRFVCAIQSQAVKLVFPRPCSLELRGRNSFSGFLAPAPVGGGISAFEQSQRAWRHR